MSVVNKNFKISKKIFLKIIKPSANMSKTCPPSSRVSPICHSAKPYGQGNTRRAHIKRRRLIMPLVALVQKKQSAPATSYSRLVLGTRYGRRRCSSKLRLRTRECFYVKYLIELSAAIAPSAQAVTICLRGVLRMSPATKTPSTEVAIFSSAKI